LTNSECPMCGYEFTPVDEFKSYSSIEEMMEVLGLLDFDEYRENKMAENAIRFRTMGAEDPRERQTGRSTRMILDALLRSQDIPVLISGRQSMLSRKLQVMAVDIAVKLGLNPKNILRGHRPQVSLREETPMLIRGGTQYECFFDHTLYGTV
jgi:hypothetical protein